MNRRTFIRSLMAGIAGVVGAPLMRRSEVQRIEFDVIPPSEVYVPRMWATDTFHSYRDTDKIRFVRGLPATIYGWDYK